MRKAGDILAAYFDEGTMKKARTYGSLFNSWTSLLENCGLPQGSSHSRIAELERSVLLVEADHPGWIQILQTRQRELLDAARRRFPELALTGISFRLSRNP
jgi:predicted nucleic acid-binding Zn ribbon protein